VNGQQAGGGIGLGGALALLFIGLKLGGVIGWPWVWVLAPLWISVLLVVLLLFVLAIAFLFASGIDYYQRERREQQMVDTQREREGLPPANAHGPAFRWGRRGR
jgi:fatty acid desaturase